jgi:hypothetical protein
MAKIGHWRRAVGPPLLMHLMVVLASRNLRIVYWLYSALVCEIAHRTQQRIIFIV